MDQGKQLRYKIKHKENMPAPSFQEPKKIQFRQNHQEYKEVKRCGKHIICPNDIKGTNQ
jgi:hypothetical protein